MNRIAVPFFLLLTVVLTAQINPDSIYNDDPLQKIPIGVKPPSHRFIDARGGQVDQARVHPPNWWIGMAEPILEILIYDQNIRDYTVSIDYPGVVVKEVIRLQNPNYLFVQVLVRAEAEAGRFDIRLQNEGQEKTYSYSLLEKKRDSERIQGVDASDLIYLIMPDRFANGDVSNDSQDDMKQEGINREKVFFRHGGDLIGIMEHLEYLQQLGVTALWLNPVLENDQYYESYHGYAITEHYTIDARLGSNLQYKYLADICQARGIKLIKDIVHNHVGDQHWFIRDLPDETWIHQFKDYTKTTYRAPTLMDPYAAESDKKVFSDGWFDHHMPDLNQQHPQLANYLIQNNIWWIEFAGLDGFRVDTYAYSDEQFMANWANRIKTEYPEFSIFGETWVHGAAIQAQFTQNNDLREGYNSHLPGVTDFQLHYAILEALQQQQGWTSGLARIYYTLAKDFLYENPYRNVLFLDNHDLARIYTVLGEDMSKFKSGMALLMTLRGIPMLYYGTELLITGEGGGAFGEAGRRDFPGGWASDVSNKFYAKDRSTLEQEAFSYIRKLGNYRRNTPALHSGKMTQFIPEDGIYVFFRYDAEKTIMVISNSNNEARSLNTSRYKERLLGFKSARDILTEKTWAIPGDIPIERNATLILELSE